MNTLNTIMINNKEQLEMNLVTAETLFNDNLKSKIEEFAI